MGKPDHLDQKELLRLYRFYYREAERCSQAKAYYAGCVMLGAACEAALLGMVDCTSEAVRREPEAGKILGKKAVEQLSLADLLAIAEAMGWLPRALDPRRDATFSNRRAQVGDYVDVLRMIRNLIHPGKWMSDQHGTRITRRYLDYCFDVVDVIRDRIVRELVAVIEKSGGTSQVQGSI
jgi:hypothetical protein